MPDENEDHIVKRDGPFRFYSGKKRPNNGDIVIAYKDEGRREQCEYRDGNYFVWRYEGKTNEIYVTDSTVFMYRYCTGFDF